MQLELFSLENSFKEGFEERGLCNRCKQSLPRTQTFFAVKRVTLNAAQEETKWLSNTCKTCEKKGSSASSKLRDKYYHTMGDCCDCCGKTSNKLRLDHDHETEKFRGWLCDNCNTGIGRLGDSIEGVQAALDYLNKHYSKG